jgi:hypothetical protein
MLSNTLNGTHPRHTYINARIATGFISHRGRNLVYDNEIILDYALNLFQGKLIKSEPVKPLKPISKPVLPMAVKQSSRDLNLSAEQISIIATMDPDTVERCLDLMWSFSGIKSVLAARAIQDYIDVLSLTAPVKFSPQAVRSLLRRLGLVPVLVDYYRYLVRLDNATTR